MPLFSIYDHLLSKRYHLEARYSERHHVLCDDGISLSLKRYRPKQRLHSRKPPVLCIPGLGANAHNFEAPPEGGLAHYLSEQGYDVWIVDLRGTGLSTVTRHDWKSISFDLFVDTDLPAVISYIQRLCGTQKVQLVGHSMGGMCIYAYLSRFQSNPVDRCITINSPLGFSSQWSFFPLLGRIAWIADFLPGLRVRSTMRRVSPLLRRSWEPLSEILAPRGSMDPALSRRLLYASAEDIPPGLMLQFRDWISNDVFRTLSQAFDYRAALKGINTPTLVLTGQADQIAPLDSVLRGLGILTQSKAVICGTDFGFSYDYGHVDTVLGRKAREEIFPKINRFLSTGKAFSTE